MMKSDQPTRLGIEDVHWATDLLMEAFLNEPPATYLFKGESARRRSQTRYFMHCTCKYALLYGECYTTAKREAVALWLVPGRTAMTLGRMFRAGMLAAPFRMGFSAFSRFSDFANHTDALHRRFAPQPHYYLFALAVKPGLQGGGIGNQLAASMFKRIDDEGMPAYLETQKERNVGLYERLGFRIAACEAFPKLEGLSNWAMVRTPNKVLRSTHEDARVIDGVGLREISRSSR